MFQHCSQPGLPSTSGVPRSLSFDIKLLGAPLEMSKPESGVASVFLRLIERTKVETLSSCHDLGGGGVSLMTINE